MRLLLDTQLLLWAAGIPERLSRDARALIAAESNMLFFSASSLWEVSIKRSLGREDFEIDPRKFRHGLLENGYGELAITGQHAVAVLDLPPIHKDPFDRMLVAQAVVEGMTLLTADDLVRRYPGPIKLV